MTATEQETWEARLIEFGKRTLDELNIGKLSTHDASKYALQFYGAHLWRASANNKSFYELVSEGWMRARQRLDGTYSGFLSDVGRAWKRADEQFLKFGRSEALVMQFKCALCRASVITLNSKYPPRLLMLALKTNQLSEFKRW